MRKARELAYRDLGGLVFSLHRFGQRNDALVLAKLSTLGQIDTELRALESALQEPQPITVLREAGITACARCAAIHSSEDRFCPNCGMPLSRRADLPVAGPAAAPASSPPPRSGVPVVTAVRAWTGAAAAQPASPALPEPSSAQPQDSPALPQAPAATDRATDPRAPVPAQPQRPGVSTPPQRADTTEVFARRHEVADASREAKSVRAPAPLDGRPAAAPELPGAPGDDQPTEIMRPSGPTGP